MPEYDNDNRGAIWKNDRKESDRHPDFKGSAMVAGVEYWVSGWKRGPDDPPNRPALKMSFQPKEQQSQPAQQKQEAFGAKGDFDDDLPF